jgi:hypothetical protein
MVHNSVCHGAMDQCVIITYAVVLSLHTQPLHNDTLLSITPLHTLLSYHYTLNHYTVTHTVITPLHTLLSYH